MMENLTHLMIELNMTYYLMESVSLEVIPFAAVGHFGENKVGLLNHPNHLLPSPLSGNKSLQTPGARSF